MTISLICLGSATGFAEDRVYLLHGDNDDHDTKVIIQRPGKIEDNFVINDSNDTRRAVATGVVNAVRPADEKKAARQAEDTVNELDPGDRVNGDAFRQQALDKVIDKD